MKKLFLMKSVLSVMLSMVTMTGLVAQEKYFGIERARNIHSEFNLNFEIVDNGIPKGWLIPPATMSEFYASLDSINVTSGKYSIALETFVKDSVVLIGYIMPNLFSGEKLTLTASIKTENVTDGNAGLYIWLPPHIREIDSVGVSGTTDWKRYELTVDINQVQFQNIIIGGILYGSGKAWFDDFNVFVDGVNINEPSPDL
jgi:hypothetical protein